MRTRHHGKDRARRWLELLWLLVPALFVTTALVWIAASPRPQDASTTPLGVHLIRAEPGGETAPRTS